MRAVPATLRGRVVALAVGTALLVIVLAAVPLALLLQEDAHADALHRAEAAAESTADFLSRGPVDDQVVERFLDRLGRRVTARVTVLRSGREVLGASLSAALRRRALALQPPDARGDDDLGTVSRAAEVDVPDGVLVQVFVQGPDGVTRVLVRLDESVAEPTLRTRYAMLAGGSLLLLVLAWAAAAVTGRRLARPLQRTAATAAALGSGDLAARAPLDGPEEVVAFAQELNALADRIDELLRLERETVADLSHRLRTPLTAVRLAAEALPPGVGKDEVERQVAGLERSLTQVVRAARRGLREGVHARADAVVVARERFAFWQPLAEDQGRRATLRVPEVPLSVRVSAEDLAGALDALLENVFAHTPEGAGFTVEVGPGTGGAVLDVLDTGPGIPDVAIRRGHSDRGSSGLGLDIARAAAEASGGSLQLLHDRDRHGVRLVLGHG